MSTDPSSAAAWPSGFDCLHLADVDSTMAEAARRAAQLTRPTWIIADRQTAGRGRLGRAWAGATGNLATTMIYRPDADPAAGALRSFVAANALMQALLHYVPQKDLAHKWPNDVLLRGGKVAGILLESSGAGKLDWLAIGVGVNLAHASQVPDAAFAPTSLAQAGAIVTPAAFLTQLARAFAEQEVVMQEKGFAPIRQAWLAHAARLGQEITARTPRRTLTGRFETITETGALVLQCATGTETLNAAEVFF